MTISLEIPFIIATKEASASASDTLVAIEKPSHHRVELGRGPLPKNGAEATAVVEVIASVEPSSSIIGPARVPQKFANAKSPASHNA